jgi:hypothetical protein
MPHRVRQAQRSLWVMRQLYKASGVSKHPDIILRLFDCIVKPSAMWGCEIWGSLFGTNLDPIGKGVMTAVEMVHFHFLRQLFTLPRSTKRWVVYTELSRPPFHCHMWDMAFRFWNRLLALPATSFFRKVMEDNLLENALRHVDNWASDLILFSHRLGSFTLAAEDPDTVDISSDVVRPLREHYLTVFAAVHPDPRLAPSDGVTLCTYACWFYPDPVWEKNPYIRLRLPHNRLQTLLRFKTGGHHLGVRTGRFHGTPRADRLCQYCLPDVSAIDDEFHFVFECPRFDALRADDPELFEFADGSMLDLFRFPQQTRVVQYVWRATCQCHAFPVDHALQPAVDMPPYDDLFGGALPLDACSDSSDSQVLDMV